MLLAIDVGNTNTVLGLFEGDVLAHSWRIKTDPRSTADEIRADLPRAARPRCPTVTGVALCSTVPAVLREMRTMLARYYGARAGRDRRARHAHRGAGAGGQPQGGRAPTGSSTPWPPTTCTAGRRSSSTSAPRRTSTSSAPRASSSAGRWPRASRSRSRRCSSRAAQLRKVELVRPRSVIGKNTVEALQSGALYGFAGQVDGLVDRIVAELGGPVPPSSPPGAWPRWCSASRARSPTTSPT